MFFNWDFVTLHHIIKTVEFCKCWLWIEQRHRTPVLIEFNFHIETVRVQSYNTWALVSIIFGGTLVACFSIFVSWCYYHKRKHEVRVRPFAHEDSVYDPILNGNTLQDIIELTSSGSGSGQYFFIMFYMITKIKYVMFVPFI